MRTKTTMTVAAVLGLTGLGACASTGSAGPARAAICRPAAAAALVGQAAPDDAAILRRTRSTIVRRIAPGDATTKDFRQERITVTVDQGRVVAASCG